MEYTSIPIIVISCYIIGELYKIIFKKKPETYKLIPILLSISGTSSTRTNHEIKQIIEKGKIKKRRVKK